jgi:trimeric autotransporter adhesin
MAEPRRSRVIWIAGGAVVVALVVAGGVSAYAVTTSGAASGDYRTATVATGDVTQTLSLAGTVERVNQVTAAFPASGTVTGVSVQVGSTVQAGQTLATMDTTALNASLLSAQATLAQDQATLASDESGSSSGSSSGASAGGGSAGSSSGSSATRAQTASTTTDATAALTAQLAQANDALTTLQGLVTKEDALCTPVIGSTGTAPSTAGGGGGSGGIRGGSDPVPATPAPTDTTPTPSDTPTPTPTPTPTDSPTPTPSPSPTDGSGGGDSGGGSGSGGSGDGTTPTPEQISACLAAISTTAQALRSTEASVASIVQHLSAVAKSSTGSGGGAGDGTASSGSGASGGSGSTARSASSGSTATRVAADEVAILQDQQTASQAQSDLDAANLTAPIGGTVAEVDLTTGQAAGSTDGIVIVGDGAAVVTVDIPLSDMSAVHAGLTADVTPAGAVQSLPGTVQSVDLLPGSSTSGYPAKVLVADPPASLASGSSATVAVTTDAATDALRVPASAMSGRTGDAGTVTVLSNGRPTITPVTVGAVGGGYAQILSGLSAGQQVVLADASEALPSNTTVGGGGAGFSRGGFGGTGTSNRTGSPGAGTRTGAGSGGSGSSGAG